MEILTKEKCQECGGSGVVYHHAWQEFNQADDKFKLENNGAMMTQQQCEEWFRQRGYGTLPPEEPQCHECEGSGAVQRWLDAQTLAKIISSNSSLCDENCIKKCSCGRELHPTFYCNVCDNDE